MCLFFMHADFIDFYVKIKLRAKIIKKKLQK